MTVRELLAQFRSSGKGEVELRSLVDSEKIRLGSIASYSAESLMSAVGLEGDDIESRMKSFSEQVALLDEAETSLKAFDEMQKSAQKVRSSTPAVPRRNSEPLRSGEIIRENDLSLLPAQTRSQRQMLSNPVFKQWASDVKVDSGAHLEFHSPYEKMQLRNIAETGDGAGQIQRIDTVTGAIRPPTRLLDLVNNRGKPDATVAYIHRIDRPNAAGSRAVSGNGTITEANPASTRTTIPFESVAVFAGIQKEWLQAQPELGPAVADALLYDLEDHVDEQMMLGDGANENWTGLITVMAGSGLTGQTSAVPASGANRGAFTVIRKEVGKLKDAGINPNAIFLNRDDADKVYQYLENLRFAHRDLVNPVNGEPSVRLIPIYVSPTGNIPANTAVIGDFMPNRIEVQSQGMVKVETSKEYLFGRNQDAIKVTIFGNLAVYQPFAFRTLTATNNLKEDNEA